MKKILTSVAVVLLFAACANRNNVIQTKDFKLNIETTEFVVKGTTPFEIPYTVTGATENTVVGVSGYNPEEFYVSVEPDKIVVTPQTAWVSGVMLAYADSRMGQVSLVNLCFEEEIFKQLYTPYSGDIDFMIDSNSNYLEIPLLTNLELDVNSTDSWIHFVETKAHKSTIVLSIDNNPKTSVRTGSVDILRKGTTDILMTVVIAQREQ